MTLIYPNDNPSFVISVTHGSGLFVYFEVKDAQTNAWPSLAYDRTLTFVFFLLVFYRICYTVLQIQSEHDRIQLCGVFDYKSKMNHDKF